MTNPEHKTVWAPSSAKEFGDLHKELEILLKEYFLFTSTNTLKRIKHITYVKFVCELKPNKAKMHQTRMAVGSDKVNYLDDVCTPTADLLLVKMNSNSVVLTPKARFLLLDIHNIYLNMLLK